MIIKFINILHTFVSQTTLKLFKYKRYEKDL